MNNGKVNITAVVIGNHYIAYTDSSATRKQWKIKRAT